MPTSVLDRRTLLAALAGAAVSGPAAAAARPFFASRKLPIGIQLYSVGPDAAKDLDGTLKALAGYGFRSVELAGYLGRTPQQMRTALDAAGLACTSAHIQSRGGEGSFGGDLGKLAEGLNVIGVRTAVMPSPYIPDRLEQRPASGEDIGGWLRRVLAQMTADDWKANADFLNEKGAALKKAGIMAGYHNHNFELKPLGATNGLEILLQRTDPSLVTFELDLGWTVAAGRDPAEVLGHHKGRFTMVHVKDVKASTKANYELRMDPTEVGSGALPWKTLLPAAYAAGVRGFYVEQEPPFERPRLEAAKICHDYLAGVTA